MISSLAMVKAEYGDYADSCGPSEVSEFLQAGPLGEGATYSMPETVAGGNSSKVSDTSPRDLGTVSL